MAVLHAELHFDWHGGHTCGHTFSAGQYDDNGQEVPVIQVMLVGQLHAEGHVDPVGHSMLVMKP